MADNKVPQKKCLSDDTAYKHTHFDVIDRSLLPPGTQAVPVLKKPNTNHQVEYNCAKFTSNGLDEHFNTILNCNLDNRSKTCPGMLCNNKKEITENNNLYNRNVPENPQKVELDLRPNGHTCQNYRQFDGPSNLSFTNGEKPVRNLVAGKGNYFGYAQNVNIETDLFNINRKTINTPFHRYMTPCDDCVKPCKVDAPFCAANGKAPELTNNPSPWVMQQRPIEYLNTMDSEMVDKVCAPMEKCNEVNHYSYTSQNKNLWIKDSPAPLVVGPNRNNQKCESLWNNVTRRRTATTLKNIKKF